MFNIFGSNNTAKDIIDSMPKFAWKVGPSFYIDEKEYTIGELVDYVKNLIKENKDLNDILKSIEEDGTEEHNNAIKLREENAQLKIDLDGWKKGVEAWKTQYDQEVARSTKLEDEIHEYKKGNKNWMNLYQEVVDKNTELLKNNNRLTVDNNALLNKGGLKYMEAKLQIVQNGYDKCSKQRDEFKHQLNAANKEIEALKKEKKESFEILKKAIEDESDRFHKLVSKSVDTEISLKKENEALKSKLRDYQDRLAQSFSYSDMKKLQNKVDEQKEENEKLKKDIIDYVYEKDEQKHPMYPIHWGGNDGAASAHPEEYKKWLDEQRDKAIAEKKQKEVEFNAEELLKRTTEFTDSLDNKEQVKPCPCNKCNEHNQEKISWEQAASDLALRVVKLEEKVTELSIIKSSTGYKGEF